MLLFEFHPLSLCAQRRVDKIKCHPSCSAGLHKCWSNTHVERRDSEKGGVDPHYSPVLFCFFVWFLLTDVADYLRRQVALQIWEEQAICQQCPTVLKTMQKNAIFHASIYEYGFKIQFVVTCNGQTICMQSYDLLKRTGGQTVNDSKRKQMLLTVLKGVFMCVASASHSSDLCSVHHCQLFL